jgi:adenosylmethionine-8-amino-7-oxononanoate aminotransferase
MELNQWSPGEPTKTVVSTDRYWINYSNGERHLDIHSGNSAFVLGYNDSDILDAMRNTPVQFLRGNNGESSADNNELINLICTKGKWASVAWAVSGSDAVEAAIAMNDTYWQNLGQDKNKILCFAPGYHGTTMLGKHLRGDYQYMRRAVCIPATSWKLLSEQEENESTVLADVRQKLETYKGIGCILMETIPWMNDITPYSINWWQSIRSLCDEFGILMIVDDVAVCWGKNGTLFGWESYNIQPDISSIGKALTGGYSPLGAAMCNQKVNDVLTMHSWEHGHTWAPNMQGVSAALIATKKIESLLHRVPVINKELRTIADEFELTWRGENLFMCYDTNINVSIATLSSVGKLAGTNIGVNSIKVIPPLIADDEYFDALRTGLTKILR